MQSSVFVAIYGSLSVFNQLRTTVMDALHPAWKAVRHDHDTTARMYETAWEYQSWWGDPAVRYVHAFFQRSERHGRSDSHGMLFPGNAALSALRVCAC